MQEILNVRTMIEQYKELSKQRILAEFIADISDLKCQVDENGQIKEKEQGND